MQNLISIFVIFGFLIAYEIINSYKINNIKQKNSSRKDILNKQTLYNIQKHALSGLSGLFFFILIGPFLFQKLPHLLSVGKWPFQKEVGYYDIFVGGSGIYLPTVKIYTWYWLCLVDFLSC